MATKLCTTMDEIMVARGGGDTAAVAVAGGLMVLEDGFAGFATSNRPDGTKNVQMKGVLHEDGPHMIEVPA